MLSLVRAMEIQEALDILRKLADGLDPETGKALGDASLFQRPSAVRALNRAVLALEFQQDRERARMFLPSNAGKPWSSAEDAQICDELKRGIHFEEIARIHNRTHGSIVARLIRLGKISAGGRSSGPPQMGVR